MERNPQIWTKLNGIPNPNPSPLCRITRSQFFSDHPFLLRRWLSFLTETPYTARERASESDTQRERARSTEREREREREKESEREMESEGSGAGGCSAGSIVWVRRRNGSWWPGKILGPEELDTSHLTSPRSGTPVKLLGREDASVSVSLSLSLSLYSSLHFVNAV